jgi:hypothetical protein
MNAMNLLSKRTGYVFLIVMSLSSTLSWTVRAQEDKEDARAFIVQAQKAYREAAYLGFRVKYLYTNAGTDVRPMDSLSGEMQMDKGRCRLVIDGTETIVTGRYIIQVMNDDKAIYLSSSRQGIPMDPTQVLDTVFKQMKGVQASIVAESQRKVLTLRFPPGGTYTYIRIAVDPVTGLFQQMTYGVRTAGLVGQDQVRRPGHSAPYEQEGQIDMFFSHYEKGGFGDALFDEKNFFTRAAGKYEPTGRYKDYHIFLASSNL